VVVAIRVVGSVVDVVSKFVVVVVVSPAFVAVEQVRSHVQ
jgi:hypothetical protein